MPVSRTKSVSDYVTEWDSLLEDAGDMTRRYNELHQRIDFHAQEHYYQYVPTLSNKFPVFDERLRRWLENIDSDDDKKLMFEFLPSIAFLGVDDFNKLNDVALQGPIIRWLVEQLGIQFTQSDMQDKLSQELHRHTWYCPMTDSMNISDFHHVNHLGGVNYRPDFRSIAEFGDYTKVLRYMRTANYKGETKSVLKRLVLLEDFVGTGAQTMGRIRDIVDGLDGVPILFVPLICCHTGADEARQIAHDFDNFDFEPVIEVQTIELLNPNNNFPDGSLESRVQEFAERTYTQVCGDGAERPRPYSAFGLKEAGAKIVMYSNSPANTMPFIQHSSSSWYPLFPRSARIR